jgi:hypothetical protein
MKYGIFAWTGILVVLALAAVPGPCAGRQERAMRSTQPGSTAGAWFEGNYFRGRGDVEYLHLLDIARRMFLPDPEFQNMAMLYTPRWNGLVEGPTWDAWWIQNSYGTTYCALPFYQEPFLTFLQNSQDLWFDQMGDGKRAGANDWVAPDGCLCDAARPGWIVYKQGDGRTQIHDWGMEFTAAGLLMQAELLLISRDVTALSHFLPRLERCADFLESRRDPHNNLFLAGPAGNLLAPSYAGYHRPDGSYGQAYLAGLSITTIAALDRLIELEKLGGHPEQAKRYADRRELAKQGLPLLTTGEGYFIKSLDPDGVKHGVFGASKHGYFEASPNHDAIAFRVVDDAQAEKIYDRIASIPGLRPYDFVLPNYPSLDDMYEKPEGLWAFGTWVNGGHWSTCEARMILAYYRLNQYEDARRSMQRLLTFARRFRMDNPLTRFGSEVYQPKEPINLCYDSFGPAAALIRGLFEYLYRADGLALRPHIPPGIHALEQRFPIRFGRKRLYLSTVGSGPIRAVTVNGRHWRSFDRQSISLPYAETPNTAHIRITLGEGSGLGHERATQKPRPRSGGSHSPSPAFAGLALLDDQVRKLHDFHHRLVAAGFGDSYEAAHAQLALDAVAAVQARARMQTEGKIPPPPEASQAAADRSYEDTVVRLYEGLDDVLRSAEGSADARRREIARLWRAVQAFRRSR